jgi:nucleoside-diphosphate-sugar epimerase
MTPPRSLVTGGCGFIGYHLCLALLLKGHYVICLDNQSCSNSRNLIELQKHERFTYADMDVLKLSSRNMTANLDYIYHLACPAAPKFYQANPVNTLDICYLGTRNVLDVAQYSGAKLVFTSTSEIYGNPLKHPQDESYYGNVNPIGPRSCYDEGKRVAESLVSCYPNTTIVRIFNTYGPHMNIDDGRVVNTFIKQSLTGQPLTIYGDGTQTRSMCYIDDTVRALLLAAQTNHPGPINIGNPDCEFTINQIAKAVTKICGCDPYVKNLPISVDDPYVRRPNITLAQQILKWNPQVSLEEGLIRTIKDISEELRIPLKKYHTSLNGDKD